MMIQITKYSPVTRFDLAHTLAGRGRYWTTAYLVDGMLIDTGCAHTAPELSGALAGSTLIRITNTHTHEDHIGADGRLQREREGLEILAHPLALPVLADPRGRQPLHPYRRIFWGWPESANGRPVSDGDLIETEHHRFQVIFTPGHAEDHLCLYEPEQGWLFSGDLFVGGRDRALRAGADIWQVIASLKRVVCLPAGWLFPGSARARQNPEGEITAKIEYLEALGQRVLDLHQRGSSVNEIVKAVCGGPMWIEFITLGHFTRKQLVLSYLNFLV
jgi:glyoxylase-like metal-dependent hydrolase (beta-lactamase superfamily II)